MIRSSIVRPCLAALVALLVHAAVAVAADPPRVRLLATGGTISNRTGSRMTAEELVQSIPGLARYVRAETEQFANVASSQVTLEQWLQLTRRIEEIFKADPDLAGIVVTSGTDTLEELAYFLDLTVRDARPVVVVGSMRNPSTIGYEGAANLLEGFRVAAEPSARNKGVLVVMNDEINAARDVTKTDALRLQTFQSRGYGVLGVVDSDRVVFYRDVVKRHTAKSEFDLAGVKGLPRVDIVMVYQGATSEMIKAAVDAGAKGIVVATAGAGATSPGQSEGLDYAGSKGVVVVTTTRTGSGRIAARQAPPAQPAPPAGVADPGAASARGGNQAPTGAAAARRQRGGVFIAGEDLTALKARVLLMVALTKTQDAAELQRIFTEY
jgi:L-asparaginase